ncbi:SDR family oxidoreductase [Dactylosporangium aurantiacum]|uniref:SDR family oxidoreductase n=1 Tax=Dactylosporangium aurantiacum TaxID=35754 RepID=A0A9Q9MER3_9ACTN|nr:SDR family oxidoreductase [Dactylosporangium aurantiacum]MDG6109314.1 SDR family oxidoreductase [Dactylosporangium aurantiacum]UWZ56423.1 SDR family oxidoreductase [Dactylosporangium aurantiacum]
MDLGLRDRVYVLTGASRGLGYATAEALVRDGARVVVSGRTAETVAAAVAALGEEHAAGVTGDLGDPDTGARLVTAARERFGRLDGALISVGGPPRGTATGTSEEDWLAAFRTVFLGTVRLARLVAGSIGGVAEGEDAAIGLVLSTSVRVPLGGLAISNGLRPGLAGFAKDLATELGPRGIRVVSLLPGRILTDRNRELLPTPADRSAAAAAIPLRRLGDPGEFGRVAAFLLSPAAGYVTGVAVPVDGGVISAF